MPALAAHLTDGSRRDDHRVAGFRAVILIADQDRQHTSRDNVHLIPVDQMNRSLRRRCHQLQQRMADAGSGDVRPAHGFAFSRLAPDGATGQDLAGHLGVTRSAASQMIDELEQRGYVRRLPHPTDRRGKLVALTGRAGPASARPRPSSPTCRRRGVTPSASSAWTSSSASCTRSTPVCPSLLDEGSGRSGSNMGHH